MNLSAYKYRTEMLLNENEVTPTVQLQQASVPLTVPDSLKTGFVGVASVSDFL